MGDLMGDSQFIFKNQNNNLNYNKMIYGKYTTHFSHKKIITVLKNHKKQFWYLFSAIDGK